MTDRTLTTNIGRNIIVKDFYDTFDDSNHVFYAFAAKHTPFKNDNNPDKPNDSDNFLHYVTSKEIIFGKRLNKNNIMRSVRHIPWKNEKVFSMYDDKNENLFNEDFYCVTKEGSSYSVFKCISNNNNSPSIYMPKFSETNETDELYKTLDGYVWKYMYSFSETENLEYTIDNFAMPCKIDEKVSSVAVNGSISDIIVEDNGNIIYNAYCEGYFKAVNVAGNNIIHSIQSDDVISSVTDFYKNCSIYIDSGTGAGQLKNINSYFIVGKERRILIESPFDVLPDLTSHFIISPTVKIEGDGTGANAISKINKSKNTIDSIEIIEHGKDYTYAKVSILTNTNVFGTIENLVNTKIKALLSPKNGHGSNPFFELNANKIVISTTFEGNEGGNIPVENDFRKVGILMNPLFQKCVLTVENTNGVIDDQAVYQKNSGFKATVSGVNLDGINTIRLTNIFNIPDMNEKLIVNNSKNEKVLETKIINIDKDLTFIDNRDKYSVEFITANQFEKDEKVYQNITNAYGYVYNINNNMVYLSGVTGTFNISDETTGYIAEFIGEKSKAIAKINGYIGKDLKFDSGEIISINTFEPITRDKDQNERLKFLIEF